MGPCLRRDDGVEPRSPIYESKWIRPTPIRADHFWVCLKYFKSGGAWFFLVGMRLPSALR